MYGMYMHEQCERVPHVNRLMSHRAAPANRVGPLAG